MRRAVVVIGCVAVWLGLVASAAAVPPSDQQARDHLEEMARNGILRDPFWAHAYWNDARQASTDTERADKLRWALQFDPELNPARWELVALQIRLRKPDFISHALDAFRIGLGTFPGQQRLGVWLITLAFGAFATTLTLLTLLSVAKVTPRIHHAVQERLHFLPAEVRSGATLLTVLVPLLLPLTLAPTAALFWLVLLGTVAAWTLMDRWEQRTATAALLLLLISPVVLSGWTRITAPGTPTAYLHALWASQEGLDARASATVRAAPAHSTEADDAYWAVMALESRRRGKFRAAALHLKRAIRLAPDSWAHHNNLGNVKLLDGKADDALAAYSKAKSLAPLEPLILVNEAQAWVHKLEFSLADEALKQATLLGYHLPPMPPGRAPELIVHDRTMDAGAFWLRFVQGQDQSHGLPPARIGSMVLSLVFPVRPFWVSLPLFLALWYVALVRTLPRAFSCTTCGKAICRKCHYRVMRRSLCSHCHAIRRDIHAPLRRQELLVERYQHVSRSGRVLSVVASALLPGTGLALRGFPRRAILLLTSSAVLALTAVADILWPDPSFAVTSDRSLLVLGILAGLYVLAAIASVMGYLKAPNHATQDPRTKPFAPGPL